MLFCTTGAPVGRSRVRAAGPLSGDRAELDVQSIGTSAYIRRSVLALQKRGVTSHGVMIRIVLEKVSEWWPSRVSEPSEPSSSFIQ